MGYPKGNEPKIAKGKLMGGMGKLMGGMGNGINGIPGND